MRITFNITFILLLGFLLRLAWLVLVDVNPISDSFIYDEFAISLASGNGFAYSNGTLTAYWPVGTSAIYAAIYKVFGHHYIYIAWFNLFIGVAIIYLGWLVSLTYFNKKTALLSSSFLAVWPLLIQFTTILSSELIFMFMLLLLMWLINKNTINLFYKAVLFGAGVALACYIRPTMAPLLFILPVLELIKTKNFSYFFKFMALSLICYSLLITPWSYRNTQLFGEPTKISTNFGPNLWMGNNPDSNGGYMPLPDRAFASEKARDNELKAEAIEYILNNPQQYLQLTVKRLVHTFSRETIGVVWNEQSLVSLIGDSGVFFLKLVSTLFWYAMLISGIVGLLLYLILNRWSALFFTPIVLSGYFTSIPLLTVGQDRYHYPLIPFLAYFSAYALIYLLDKYQSRPMTAEHRARIA